MKKMRYILIVPLLFVIAGSFAAIFWQSEPAEGVNIPATDVLHKSTNAIYYWRTVYKLSDTEKGFMKRYDIRRMYLRMFDVVKENEEAEPNATVKFAQKMPEDVEIVPTVFVTTDAIWDADDKDIEKLAERIVERVGRICQWNNIKNWKELQLDCDWTGNTRNEFFLLCDEVKKRLDGKLLSSTIRLHQLREDAPPVDYGVLMVYNTDNFKDPFASNSILNDTTVEQYLRAETAFNLPLDIALPIYQWHLVFSKDGKFRRIASSYYCEDDEMTKFECVPFPTLQRTNSLLKKYLHLQRGHYTTILYHLDDKNINNYSDEQIKSLYNN